MRYLIIVLCMFFWSASPAVAQVSIGISVPGVSIGINLPLYPDLERVPGYPVYYAPRMNSNYFFYDGMYWVYEQDRWYASSWYNGPWGLVEPWYVPVYVLRIPVRYYRNRPDYFRGWQADAPPRWGEHWGHDWEQQRRGWDKWDRRAAPAPAPLPVYQRNYSGDRYPRVEQQRELHGRNYRYQPRDAVVRQHYQEQAAQRPSAPSRQEQQKGQAEKNQRPPDRQDKQDSQRSGPPPVQQSAPPRAQAEPRGDGQRSAPTQTQPQQRPAAQDQHQPSPQGAAQHEQPAPRSSQGNQGRGGAQEQDKGRGKDEEKGQERNR